MKYLNTESSKLQNSSSDLRVIIITQEDPFYVYHFFKKFISDQRLGKSIKVIEVLIQLPFHESTTRLAHRMLQFWGFMGFIRMGFKFISYRILGRSVFNLLKNAGFPCRTEYDVNSEKSVTFLKQQNPDVILSVAAPQIFKQPLLDVPTYGCVNIHSGPLPRYRGMMPVFWQILHGEKKIGITIHTMAKAIDGGEILCQEFTAIKQGETLSSLIIRTKQMAAKIAMDTLERIQNRTIQREQMNTSQSSYFSFPGLSDVQKLKQQGWRLI